MSGVHFSDAAARRLEALYTTDDVVAQREFTLGKLRLVPNESVIDVGSGPGFLCECMARIVGPNGRVLGVDISAELVARAAQRNALPWLAYREGDAIRIDEPDASFDAAACTQVAEYVADVDKAIAEAFRVLKPGRRALFVATDWDAVVWQSDDPVRMAAVMKSWEAHCAHPRLPRTMPARLARAGFASSEASVFTILNLTWDRETYSKGIAGFIRAFVERRGDVAAADVAAWHDEFAKLGDEGRYFFATSRFVFLASKPRT